MDLQSYVDRRIEELESKQAGSDADRCERRRIDDYASRTQSGGANGREKPVLADNASERDNPELFDSGVNKEDICIMFDAALAEIARRVMEIADKVTEDNARIEEELMSSRLTALENAESIIDMALRIRSKTRNMMSNKPPAVSTRAETGKMNNSATCERAESTTAGNKAERTYRSSTRASMHDIGLAALFRKTR